MLVIASVCENTPHWMMKKGKYVILHYPSRYLDLDMDRLLIGYFYITCRLYYHKATFVYITPQIDS